MSKGTVHACDRAAAQVTASSRLDEAAAGLGTEIVRFSRPVSYTHWPVAPIRKTAVGPCWRRPGRGAPLLRTTGLSATPNWPGSSNRGRPRTGPT